jgi:hypothetical protein
MKLVAVLAPPLESLLPELALAEPLPLDPPPPPQEISNNEASTTQNLP